MLAQGLPIPLRCPLVSLVYAIGLFIAWYIRPVHHQAYGYGLIRSGIRPLVSGNLTVTFDPHQCHVCLAYEALEPLLDPRCRAAGREARDALDDLLAV